MTAPTFHKRPHTHVEHGIAREDPWYWLRDREDPAVRAELERQNAWTAERTAHLDGLRATLYAEFLARVQEDDASVPAPDGPWGYYYRTEAGRPHRIACRRPRDGGPEQVILDVNALGEGHAYTSVSGEETSPDHALLVYGIEHAGDERYLLQIRDLATGDLLQDAVPNVSGSFAWRDARTLWYCALDEAHRSHAVWEYRVGEPGRARLIYQEDEPRLRVMAGRTRSGRFMTVYVGNSRTSEHLLVATEDRDAPVQALVPRRFGARYQFAHAGESLLVITNTGVDDVPGSAMNSRLLEVPLDGVAPRWADAIERLPHRADTQILGVAGFEAFGAVAERARGQLGVRLLDVTPVGARGPDREVHLLEAPSALSLGTNLEWRTRSLRLGYGSLTTPNTTLALDVDTFAIERLREVPVPTYDRTKYRTSLRHAIAPDGTEVPISVVHAVDVDLAAGPHPTVLYGYGSYGVSLDPAFSQMRVSLLDRGVVFATAHVRGGGELGRAWYEAGKLEHKQNSFTDFVACARALVDAEVTAPDRLVAHGGSAGGLLVGAAMNLAPELFRAVVANVPFVDVLTTILDASLPLTAGEWDEWGDPRDRKWYDVIRAYSPYDNVRAAHYPDLLATAGWSDPRVQYWEPAKWVAKLRDVATGGTFLLRTELGSGHQGPSGRYGMLEDRARDYAWILDALGRG